MKDRSQTIINVCLAIFVATTIYNTNQLNDKIDTLERESFSNAESNAESIKFDATLEQRVQSNFVYIEGLTEAVVLNRKNIEITFENTESIDQIFEDMALTLNETVDYTNVNKEELYELKGNLKKIIDFLDGIYGN